MPDLLSAIVESSDDAIYTKSRDGVITSWNAGACRMYGYSPAEAIGRPVAMLIPVEREGEDVALLARILNGERVEHFETDRRHKSGEIIRASITLSPVHDDDGVIVGASIIARDITRRVRADEAARMLAAIVDNTDDAIYAKSPSGLLTVWNGAAERLYGYTSAEAIGRPVAMLIPRHRAGEDTALLARILTGERITHFETERVRKDGRIIPVSVTLSPIHDDHGRVTGASVIARDIADRLRAETERARYIAALEEYNAVIAHDLADPTRTIAGLASWLEGRIGSQLGDADKRALDAICHAAQRMELLIEGLRDYARLDALALDARAVDLADVVRGATNALRERLREEEAEVHVGDLPRVDGDAMLLGQLFQNLIANAVKFRGERRPHVEIGAVRRNGDWVVAVSDNGIGLDPSHADRVFGLYQRLHGEDHYEGAGVGLAVCRKIAERHGGRIWYEARPEGGTRFMVSLPASAG